MTVELNLYIRTSPLLISKTSKNTFITSSHNLLLLCYLFFKKNRRLLVFQSILVQFRLSFGYFILAGRGCHTSSQITYSRSKRRRVVNRYCSLQERRRLILKPKPLNETIAEAKTQILNITC